MTNDQYGQWYQYHVAAFPGINTWIGKQPIGQQPETMRRWQWTLRNCDHDDCVSATNEMHGNATYQGSYEGHPATIKAIAWRHKRGRSTYSLDRSTTVRCKMCNDSGRVCCWSGESISVARDGGGIDDVYSGRVGYATCTCNAAIGLYKEGEADPAGYNPRIHRVCSLNPDDAEFDAMKKAVLAAANCEGEGRPMEEYTPYKDDCGFPADRVVGDTSQDFSDGF